MYEFLKFVHVLAATFWVGAGLLLVLLYARLARSSDRDGLTAMARQAEFFGKTYFSPVSLVTLLAGIAAVEAGTGIGYGEPWIVIGLVGIAASIMLGAVLQDREGKEMLAHLEDGAALSAPEVDGPRRRQLVYSTLDIIILAVVVAAMVFKWGA